MTSVVRLYGSALINLTKITSFNQVGNRIIFAMPLSNYYNGCSKWVCDRQPCSVTFKDALEAQNEIQSIKSVLNDYYTKWLLYEMIIIWNDMK